VLLTTHIPVPWQEFGDAIDGVIGDAGQDGTQIRLGIETIELGGFDERVDGSSPLAAGIGSGEEIILAAKRNAADRSLGGIVVDLDAAIMDVADQGIPTANGVAYGFGEIGFAGEFRQGGFEPCLEVGNQRQGVLLAPSLSLIGRLAAD